MNMAYIRCSEETHRAMKKQAVDRGTSMLDLVESLWKAHANPNPHEIPEIITKNEQNTVAIEGSIVHNRKLLALASGIKERAVALETMLEQGSLSVANKGSLHQIMADAVKEAK
jgi:hypothetical protein